VLPHGKPPLFSLVCELATSTSSEQRVYEPVYELAPHVSTMFLDQVATENFVITNVATQRG
jgi:hypothetical protein